MDYVDPAKARDLPGLRLTLTAGVPAPYSMSAKAIFDLKGVSYVPVAQYGAAANEELVAWTRHRNAPVAVYNDEAPRVGWLEILNLAERLGSGPSLIPEDIDARMTMIALTNELIGENGFVWNMRVIMLGLGGPERAAKEAASNPMYAQYGYSEAAKTQAEVKAKTILRWFSEHMRRQRESGSNYLIGSRFSAADIYWAYFSQVLRSVPEERSPMPSGLRKAYDMGGAAIGPWDEALIEQRDWIFQHHLPLPMEF
jgi:glutathione S-transferase